MIPKSLDAITKADIDLLVKEAVPESRTLEYKEGSIGMSPEEKREFLADVLSFANGVGGHLLLGVPETRDEEGKPTGVPDEPVGIGDLNTDAEILRLQDMIRCGVEPRLPGIDIKAIPGFRDGPVLVLHIPKSWTGPHMVTYKHRRPFYIRHSNGKHPMDVTEIRSAFALSETFPERIKRFRDDRLAKILSGDAPFLLYDRPKIVLHMFPLAAFTVGFQLDPVRLKSQSNKFQPLCGSSYIRRFNVDGLLTHTEPRQEDSTVRDYCQVFRSGAIEAVDARLLDDRVIPFLAIEKKVTRAVSGYLTALRAIETPLPIVTMLSILGAAGYEMPLERVLLMLHPTPIDRDVLLLPDVIFDSMDCDVPQTLQPIFDALWNAAGFVRSPCYDNNGKWDPENWKTRIGDSILPF